MKLNNATKLIILKEWGAVFVSTMFIMVAAFYNRFPLVNPDSGTYISSGILLQRPMDRPITYGLLIRLFSLNHLNLWFAIFVQCFTMAWLLVQIIKQQLREAFQPIIALVIVAFLSLFSSLSWISSELIADVYTTMALLSLLLLIQLPLGHKKQLLLFAIYTCAIATHLSHLLIFVALIVLLFVAAAAFYKNELLKTIRKNLAIALLLTLSTLTVTSHSASRSGHLFFMASFLEKGVLKEYLNQTCPTINYDICKYKDTLKEDFNYFLWNTGGPLVLAGGRDKVKPEYDIIIHHIITSPKLVYHFIKRSIVFCIRQSYTFQIGDGNTPLLTDEYIYFVMEHYMPQHFKDYNNSRQSLNLLEQDIIKANGVFKYVIIISCIALPILLIANRKKFKKSFYFFLWACIALCMLNIIDCAVFAQVNGRYGCRVIWLIPMLSILAFLQMLFSAKQVTNPGVNE